MKTVARPWTGTYGEPERGFGVRPVEPDYLKDVYGTPIVDLYRKYLRETFPIAYGSGDLVSFPVDADLRAGRDLWFGAVDGSANDIVLQALNGTAYVGGHYLGGSFPPGLHTWSVRAPENAPLSVTYHASDSSRSELGFAPLKAVRLLSVTRSARETTFSVRTIGTEAIFVITCPTGAYSVDAMHISIGRQGNPIR